MNTDGEVIKESDRYKAQLKYICENVRINVDTVCDALAGAIWSAKNNPERHPVIAAENVRLVKTSRVTRGNDSVPAMRIWFRAHGNGSIELLAIQAIDVIL